MKLPERFRTDETLDPEVEAELAVIDAALSGGPVPSDDAQLAQLARELHAERAEPTEAFAAQLDRWAASGFKRSERRRPTPGSDAGRRRKRFAGLAPMIVPVGAAATLIVVVGIAISAGGGLQSGSDDSATSDSSSEALDDSGSDLDQSAEGGGAALEKAAPEAAPPTADAAKDAVEDGDVSGFRSELKQADPDNRKVVRTADLTLATEPEELREVADGVNEVTNRYEGIVVSSSVQSGDEENRRASSQFQLRIPAGNLQAALADLSELAHVESRTESTEDITGQFITAQERIEELEAERESILSRLADADTEAEAEVLRRQLGSVNSQLQATRAELEDDRQRVQLVPVTVSIVAEEGAGDDGDWGIEEAIEDAGDVLTTAAGVVLIAGAVLLPLALVALLVALVLRTRTTRARDRALDE